MNGTRLGIFEPLQQLVGATSPDVSHFFIRNVIAGATAGMLGAVAGSPFFLVKARIQAASSINSAHMNAQYQYNGMVSCLTRRYQKNVNMLKRGTYMHNSWMGFDKCCGVKA